MPNELHFICTASARLGTGKTLKKPPDADLRVLQAAFCKKKTRTHQQWKMPNYPAPSQTHLQPEICKERQISEAMHLNLTSNSNSVTRLRSM